MNKEQKYKIHQYRLKGSYSEKYQSKQNKVFSECVVEEKYRKKKLYYELGKE